MNVVSAGLVKRVTEEKKTSPTSTIDQEKFKQGLIEDVANAQMVGAQSARSRGVQDEPSSIEPKALRIKNKIIGEKELADANRMIDQVADELTHRAGITDQFEAGKYRSQMRKKLHQFKMEMTKRAGDFEMRMNRDKLSRQEREAMMGQLTKITQGGAMMAASYDWNKKKPEVPVQGESRVVPGAGTMVPMGSE